MKRTCKSEWFVLEKPIEEPEVVYTDQEYHIERTVSEEGIIVWFGLHTNWKKEKEGPWTKLIEGKFVECQIPKYEWMREALNPVIRGNALCNLQPLWAKDNIIKKDKWK